MGSKSDGDELCLGCTSPQGITKPEPRFSPGPSCRGSFGIKAGSLAATRQQGMGTLSFCFWSQAEVIENSSFMHCGGSRSLPYPMLRESCLALCFPLLSDRPGAETKMLQQLSWV